MQKMTWENNVTVTLHNDSIESLYTGDIVTGIITLDIKKDLKVESKYKNYNLLLIERISKFLLRPF